MSRYAKRIDEMDGEVKKLKVLTDALISPTIISFAGGAPAKEAYPFEQIREICNDILKPNEIGYSTMVYGSQIGNLALREAVRDYLLKPRGLDANVENIMITAGGIQPLNFMCMLYLEPGDTILVEKPTFVHADMIFKMFQANFVPCEMDDHGLIMEDVEEKIKKYQPKFIYTIPTFQNPTGVTLSQERRKKLAQLANKYDVMVLEDDPYREIRYSGEELVPIKSFDKKDNVIFSGSFSKIFSPGSRLGFLVASDEQIQKFCNIKLGTDTCTNTMMQVIAAEFFKRGYYPQHLENLKNLYRSRRDAMIQALDAYFPDGTKHTYPDGGYYIWAELPKGLDATALAQEIGEKLNICYGNGSIFYSEGNPEGSGNRCMRLNFSGQTEESISANFKILGEFLKAKLMEK